MWPVVEVAHGLIQYKTCPRRAFRRLVGKNPSLQPQIETALQRMAEDVNDPRLKTHHLSGQLKGLHASTIAYDCGFRDYTHFARKFRHRFGCSPGAHSAAQARAENGAVHPAGRRSMGRDRAHRSEMSAFSARETEENNDAEIES